MYKLKIRIKLTSPVIISSQSGDSTLTGTLSYIPGTTILGLLACKYLKSQGDDSSFNRLFLRGDVHFQNLYPLNGSAVFLPCQGNLWRSKTNPDELVDIFANTDTDQEYKKIDSFVSIRDEYVEFLSVEKEIFFHHERDYARGVSKPGVVFNYEAISEGQEFMGHLLGTKEDLTVLKQLLEHESVLRIGKSKTSQYGNAILLDCEISEWESVVITTDDKPLLVMASDTILKNAMGTSTINVADLELILGVNIVSASIDTVRIETIINAHKAKKPSELAFKAGSCFLLENVPPDAEAIVRNGLGARTWEGYGQVFILDNLPEKFYSHSISKQDCKLPESPLPDVIKLFAASVRDQVMSTLLSTKATEIAKLIEKRSLSNSLLGRLESFAASGNFAHSFAQIREISMQKIRRIHLGNKSFDEYLKGIDQEIIAFISTAKAINLGQNKKLVDLERETDLPELSIETLKSQYLQILFLSIRRINKKNRESK